MRILHYIPSGGGVNCLRAAYIGTLTAGLHQYAESMEATTIRQLKALATQSEPDVVHIHTCWNWRARVVQRWCYSRHIPVIVSLYGGMQPHILRSGYWLKRMPMLAAFQKDIICGADAIHTLSAAEEDTLRHMGSLTSPLGGSETWNPRMATIPLGLEYGGITRDMIARRMLWLYQKVIDSNVFWRMTDTEKNTEKCLLRAAIARENRDMHVDQASIDAARTLEPKQWQRLLIHCYDMDVLNLVRKGASRLGLELPDVNPKEIVSFSYKQKKRMGGLRGDSLEENRRSMRTAMHDLQLGDKEAKEEIRICYMLLNVRLMLEKQLLTTHHLTDFYNALRYNDYDEYLLRVMLGHLGQMDFMSRLLQVLSESLGLEEGFMPMPAINDKGTSKMRQAIMNANIF